MSKIFTVTLPDIGEGVVEGEVIEWLKNIGDPIKQDEPIVVVMTDKATVELPAPYPGKLSKHYFKPAELAIKDKPLYDIELLEGQVTHPSKQDLAHQPNKNAPCPAFKKSTTPTAAFEPSVERGLAVPHVRKLAQKLAIDIHALQGSGKEGRVTAEDLHRFQQTKQNSITQANTPLTRLPGDEEIHITGIRNLMAKKMAESKRIIPHFSFFEQVEATRLVKLRQNFKSEAAKECINITYMPFMIRALSLTLKKFKLFNSSIATDSNHIIVHQQQNIGIAMSTGLGLIVPVLKNVQEMNLHTLIRAYEALKVKAQHNKLQSSDMKEATITISNFGVLGGGGLWATPIINYPEVAILAVARIQKQPTIKNDQVEIRDMLNLSWSFDHRLIDGDMAATFSNYYARLIYNPALLL